MGIFSHLNLHHDTAASFEKLSHPGVVEYFSGNSHRIAAFRALLDLLAIPLPDWAKRDLSGRGAASRNLMAAFKADNPKTASYILPPRKDDAPSRPTI